MLVAFAAAAANDGALVVRARFPCRVAGKRARRSMPLLLASARESRSTPRPPNASRTQARPRRTLDGRPRRVAAGVRRTARGRARLPSYPLHPAGKPDKLRDAHLPAIRCPMLFVQGDRDTLCDLALLRPVLKKLGKRAELSVFAGADHGMRKAPADEIARVATTFLARI